MDTQLQPELTMRDALPWVKMMFDLTDKVAALIPEDMLDWRPKDPSGNFCFSLGEIAVHCADARLMFISQLTGEDRMGDFWAELPDEDGVWRFKKQGDKSEILEYLKSTRAEFDEWLEKPASAMTMVTDGAQTTFERNLEWFKENDMDSADYKRAGPPSIVRVLMAVSTHESGHRGALQTLLRLRGINVGEE